MTVKSSIHEIIDNCECVLFFLIQVRHSARDIRTYDSREPRGRAQPSRRDRTRLGGQWGKGLGAMAAQAPRAALSRTPFARLSPPETGSRAPSNHRAAAAWHCTVQYTCMRSHCTVQYACMRSLHFRAHLPSPAQQGPAVWVQSSPVQSSPVQSSPVQSSPGSLTSPWPHEPRQGTGAGRAHDPCRRGSRGRRGRQQRPAGGRRSIRRRDSGSARPPSTRPRRTA